MNYFTVLESNSKIMRLIFSLRKELAPFFSERDIDAVTISLCVFFLQCVGYLCSSECEHDAQCKLVTDIINEHGETALHIASRWGYGMCCCVSSVIVLI